MQETLKIFEDAIRVLENGREPLEKRLSNLDKVIKNLQQESENRPENRDVIQVLLSQREELIREIDKLNTTVEGILQMAHGTESKTFDSIDPLLSRIDFSYCTKLADLLKFYLMLMRGGPVKLTKIVADLKERAKVYSRRARKGEDPREKRAPKNADIIKLVSDLRSGYSSPKQKTTSQFHFDRNLKTVRLIRLEDRVKEPKAKKSNVDGRAASTSPAASKENRAQSALA